MQYRHFMKERQQRCIARRVLSLLNQTVPPSLLHFSVYCSVPNQTNKLMNVHGWVGPLSLLCRCASSFFLPPLPHTAVLPASAFFCRVLRLSSKSVPTVPTCCSPSEARLRSSSWRPSNVQFVAYLFSPPPISTIDYVPSARPRTSPPMLSVPI